MKVYEFLQIVDNKDALLDFLIAHRMIWVFIIVQNVIPVFHLIEIRYCYYVLECHMCLQIRKNEKFIVALKSMPFITFGSIECI